MSSKTETSTVLSAGQYKRPQQFTVTRGVCNFTSLNAALVQIFKPEPLIEVSGVEALEYTLPATAVDTRFPGAVADKEPRDTFAAVTLEQAGYNLRTPEDMLDCASTGGFWPERATELDATGDELKDIDEEKSYKIRVIEILKCNSPEISSDSLKTLLGDYYKNSGLQESEASMGVDFTRPSGISIVKPKENPAIVMIRIPFLNAQGRSYRNGKSLQSFNRDVLERVDTGFSYGDLKFMDESGTREVGICQAWAATINHRVLLIYAGNDYTEAMDHPIVVPHQSRIGAYLALARFLAKILIQSDQKLVEHFTRELSNLQIQGTAEAMNFSLNLNLGTLTIEELYGKAATAELQATTIHGMMLQQVQVLKELICFFELAIYEKKGASRTYTKEWVFVNGVSQFREQIVVTLISLRETTSNREALTNKLEGIMSSFRVFIGELQQRIESRRATKALEDKQEATKDEISRGFATMASSSSKQSDRLQDGILAQNKQQEVLNNEIFHQGQVISLFTVVSTVFLPLGFFTSYFGMDILGDGLTMVDFWVPTGLVTGVISVFCICYMVISRWEVRRLIKLFTDVFIKARWILFWRRWSVSRQDISSTQIHLKMLPKYHVRLESTTGAEEILYLMAPSTDDLTINAMGRSIWKRILSKWKTQADARAGSPGQTSSAIHDEIYGPIHLRFSEKKCNSDVFRFDEEKGWLYLDKSEPLYNFMYRMHCSLKAGSSFLWKGGQMQMDHEPFRFRSHFKAEMKELEEKTTKRMVIQLNWVTSSLKAAKLPWWTAMHYTDGSIQSFEEFTIGPDGRLRVAEPRGGNRTGGSRSRRSLSMGSASVENSSEGNSEVKRYRLYLEEPVGEYTQEITSYTQHQESTEVSTKFG